MSDIFTNLTVYKLMLNRQGCVTTYHKYASSGKFAMHQVIKQIAQLEYKRISTNESQLELTFDTR